MQNEQLPTIEQLRERLAGFEQAYALCDYIDHWPDVLRCRERNTRHITAIRNRIAVLEQAEAEQHG